MVASKVLLLLLAGVGAVGTALIRAKELAVQLSNASYGAASKTKFDAGGLGYDQLTFGIDARWVAGFGPWFLAAKAVG